MATLYWVGGSGSWSDSQHWSNASGGTYPSTLGLVPTTNDDVIFNASSAAANYNVDCGSYVLGTASYCKSITTSVGAFTLTFRCNDAYEGRFIYVQGGNINIHAGCSWTIVSSYLGAAGRIDHYAPGGSPVSLTTSFGSSGANTSVVQYNFYASGLADNLNFCSSATCTFSKVNIGMTGGTFT